MEQNEILILHGTDYAAWQISCCGRRMWRHGSATGAASLRSSQILWWTHPRLAVRPRIRSLWPAQLNICMKTDSKTFA